MTYSMFVCAAWWRDGIILNLHWRVYLEETPARDWGDDLMVVAMSPLRGYLKCTYSTPGSFSRICACMVPNVQTSDPVHVTTD